MSDAYDDEELRDAALSIIRAWKQLHEENQAALVNAISVAVASAIANEWPRWIEVIEEAAHRNINTDAFNEVIERARNADSDKSVAALVCNDAWFTACQSLLQILQQRWPGPMLTEGVRAMDSQRELLRQQMLRDALEYQEREQAKQKPALERLQDAMLRFMKNKPDEVN